MSDSPITRVSHALADLSQAIADTAAEAGVPDGWVLTIESGRAVLTSSVGVRIHGPLAGTREGILDIQHDGSTHLQADAVAALLRIMGVVS